MTLFYLTGLMYFDGCEADEKRALLPDGTDHNPPHFASLFIEKAATYKEHWFPGQIKDPRTVTVQGHDRDVVEFRIPVRSVLTFPDDADIPAKCVDFEDGLPKLQDADPAFEPNLVDPDTIAEVVIRGGTLRPLMLNKVPVVQWEVANQTGPITIRARALGDDRQPTGPEFTFTVPAGTDVILSNSPDFIANSGINSHHGSHPVGPHFELYEKIAKAGHKGMLSNAKAKKLVGPLKPTNAYLQYLEKLKRFEVEGCTGSCCTPPADSKAALSVRSTLSD